MNEWAPERHIRMVRVTDAAEIAAIYRPSVTDAATSFEVDAPDGAEMARRIEAVLAVAPWLVCLGPAGDVVGYAYAAGTGNGLLISGRST